MRYFLRSVKYVLAYKLRLLGMLICVLLIASLWAAGLSALLPAMKVLMSDEGLHGWVDLSVVSNRLGVEAIRRNIAAADRPRFGGASVVVEIRDVDDKSPLVQKVSPGDLIVGLDGEYLPCETVLDRLAAAGDESNALMVLRAADGVTETVDVVEPPAERQNRWLYEAATRLPRPARPEERWGLLATILVIALGLTYLRDALRFCQTYLVQTTVQRAIMDIRVDNYAVAVRLPLSHYAVHGTSDTMSRFMADCDQISRGLVTLFGKTLVEPAKLIGVFAVALTLNWKLTLLACVTGPPTVLLIGKLGKKIRKASRRALEGQAELLASLEETLNGLRVVKAYTTEQVEQKRFRGITKHIYKQMKRVSAADAATAPMVEAMGITAALAAVALAGYWVFCPGSGHTGAAGWLLDNKMDPEIFLAVMGTLFALFDPVRRLSHVTVNFFNADAAAKRVFDLQDEAVEADLTGAEDLPRHSEAIEFRDLSYTYPGAARPALTDVSLKIWQGESVAFVGGNGSGKTTLLSMLPRFYAPGEGQILIDGVDIAGVKLESLRRQIGLVTQECVIFNTSVADNIAYGTPDVTREQIEAAAKQAFADEFISQMSDGYDTVIGQRGSTLSGGQRQRIAIARAILRDPAIMILDEAMSQIDSESEAKINRALETFVAGRTTLLIAHRFSTVVNADTVVVLYEGRVVDIGKHEELVNRCEIYRTLFETQLIGE